VRQHSQVAKEVSGMMHGYNKLVWLISLQLGPGVKWGSSPPSYNINGYLDMFCIVGTGTGGTLGARTFICGTALPAGIFCSEFSCTNFQAPE